MFKTRYAVPTSSSVTVENYAFLVVNQGIADHFGGKCYQYIYDLNPDASVLKTKSLVEYFFPYGQIQSVCRHANMSHYREAAIELVRQGKAVVYTQGADAHMYRNMAPAQQAVLAADEEMGIKLADSPEFVLQMDDLTGKTEEYKFCATHQAINLFYPHGFPNSMFCNVVDDSLLEVTHCFRESRCLAMSAQEILLHAVLETVPPFFAHIDLPQHNIDQTLPWDHMINELPPTMLNNVFFESLTSGRPGTTCDFSFVRPRIDTRIDKKALHKEMAEWFQNCEGKVRLRILQSLFPIEDAPDLQKASRHMDTSEYWAITEIQNFVEEFCGAPSYFLPEMPTQHEARNLTGLMLALQLVPCTPDELSKVVLEAALSLSTHVTVLDKLLYYGILGRRRPVNIYEVMTDLGKHSCLRRLEKLAKMLSKEVPIRS